MAQIVPIDQNNTTSWAVRMANSVLQTYSPDRWKWQYEHGLLVWAIAEAGRVHGEDRFTSLPKDWIDHFVSESGVIHSYHVGEYNLDQILPGRLLFSLYDEAVDPRYAAAIKLLRCQLQYQPRTPSRGFWHKKIYPNQMWLDGLYMAEPFYARYARVFDEPEIWDEVVYQFTLSEQHMRDPHSGLLYHAWDESHVQKWADPETGCSPCFWGRAIGWYVMALVDVLDLVPESHAGRPALLAILDRLATALVRFQDRATGLWHQVVNQPERPGNYRESSVSAMLAYGFTKAVRNGWLAPEFISSARRAYRGLLENMIRVDGRGLLTLDGICGVAGLSGNPYRDGSYEYYVSEPVVSNDFKGVGPFILAAIELEAVSAIQGTFD